MAATPEEKDVLTTNAAASPPMLSIITACYNSAGFIRDAIESARRQDHPTVEHIIVDGGSTDGTLEILREYPHLHVVSEPDQGIYDGFNKGIRRARGEIIGILNSDDLYADHVFAKIVACFQAHPQMEALSGGADIFAGPAEEPQVLRSNPAIAPEQRWQRVSYGVLNTNAWFFRRALFDRVGLFDSAYRVAGDRDFFIRLLLSGVEFAPFDEVVYHYRWHSGSATKSPLAGASRKQLKTRSRALGEGIDIAEKYLGSGKLPPGARPSLLRLHRDRSYQLVSLQLHHGAWRPALQAAGRACRYNPSWPLFLLLREGRRALRWGRRFFAQAKSRP